MSALSQIIKKALKLIPQMGEITATHTFKKGQDLTPFISKRSHQLITSKTKDILLDDASKKRFLDNIQDYYSNERKRLTNKVSELQDELNNAPNDIAADYLQRSLRVTSGELSDLNSKVKALDVDNFVKNKYDDIINSTLDEVPIEYDRRIASKYTNPITQGEQWGGVYEGGRNPKITLAKRAKGLGNRNLPIGVHEQTHAVGDAATTSINREIKNKVGWQVLQSTEDAFAGAGSAISLRDNPIYGSWSHLIPKHRQGSPSGKIMKYFDDMLGTDYSKGGKNAELGLQNLYYDMHDAIRARAKGQSGLNPVDSAFYDAMKNMRKELDLQDISWSRILKVMRGDMYLTEPGEITARINMFRSLPKHMQNLDNPNTMKLSFMKELSQVFPDKKVLKSVMDKAFSFAVPLGVSGAAVSMS